MGKYSKEKNYDNLIAFNVTRKEYKCPCCGKTYLLANCKLEKFELFRELVFNRRVETHIRYAGYRLCPKCFKRRELTFTIPLRVGVILLILAVITSVIAFCIDPHKYGLTTLGFWLAFATPIWIILWMVPNIIY